MLLDECISQLELEEEVFEDCREYYNLKLEDNLDSLMVALWN